MPCPLCDDTGWKPSTGGSGANGIGQKSDSAKSDGPRVVRCDCWKQNVAEQRLADARIPKRYQHCTIANFSVYNESLERAAAQARCLADAFPVVKKGLFLEGQPGVGKTHLVVAVLKQIIQTTGARGLFYDTRDLLRVIRSTYDPSIHTTEIEVLNPVMRADILVLDDLGAEKTSEWVEETMNLIVNTRYNERRLTLFTSNYPDIPDETEPNSLLFRIGFRMRSRLHEMCEFITLDAADYRERPENAGSEDLLAMWKLRKKILPSPRGGRQARAQLREPVRDGRGDLKWPGGPIESMRGPSAGANLPDLSAGLAGPVARRRRFLREVKKAVAPTLNFHDDFDRVAMDPQWASHLAVYAQMLKWWSYAVNDLCDAALRGMPISREQAASTRKSIEELRAYCFSLPASLLDYLSRLTDAL